MVLFLNLLGKRLTQEINEDRGSIWWAPALSYSLKEEEVTSGSWAVIPPNSKAQHLESLPFPAGCDATLKKFLCLAKDYECLNLKYLKPAFFTFQARSPRTLWRFPYKGSTIRLKDLEKLYIKPYKNSYDNYLVILYFLLSKWNLQWPSRSRLDIILVPRTFGYCRKKAKALGTRRQVKSCSNHKCHAFLN